MKFPIFLLAIAVAFLTGCVSKSKSDARAQQAYLAGQREGAGAAQNRTVSILGDVKTHNIPWTEELTLSKALLAAEYKGFRDPRQIQVRRGTERYDVKVRSLLSGQEDPTLLPGDIVEIR